LKLLALTKPQKSINTFSIIDSALIFMGEHLTFLRVTLNTMSIVFSSHMRDGTLS